MMEYEIIVNDIHIYEMLCNNPSMLEDIGLATRYIYFMFKNISEIELCIDYLGNNTIAYVILIVRLFTYENENIMNRLDLISIELDKLHKDCDGQLILTTDFKLIERET